MSLKAPDNKNLSLYKSLFVLSFILALTAAGCVFESAPASSSRSAYKSNGGPLLVPDDFSNIQSALNSAAEGDSIMVASDHIDPGFTVDRTFAANIFIIASGPGRSKIHGSVEIKNNYSGPIEISGFIITNPNGEGVRTHFNADNILIKNCLITECAGDGVRVEFKAGISREYQNNSHLATIAIQDCEITSNKGRGIFVNSFGAVELSGCTISDNGSDGVYAEHLSVASLDFCTVSGNMGHGIRLYRQSTGRITNTAFSGNKGNAVYIHKLMPLECSSSEIPTEYNQNYIVKPTIIKGNSITTHQRGIVLEERAEAEEIRDNTLSGVNEGIVVSSRSIARNITSNFLEGPGDYGIIFQKQSHGAIDSNEIKGFEGIAGILIDRMDEEAEDAPSCPLPEGWLQRVKMTNNNIHENAINLIVSQNGRCDLESGNTLWGALGDGINAQISANLNILSGNQIYNNQGSGAHFEKLSTGTISGSEIFGNGADGISIEKMENREGNNEKADPVRIESCQIRNNGEWGVRIGFDEENRGRAWAMVADNSISANGSGGVIVQRTSRATIKDNDMAGLDGDDEGIIFLKKSDGLVEGNKISNFSSGVVVAQFDPPEGLDPDLEFDISPVAVKRNHITNNSADGIVIGLDVGLGRGNAEIVNNIISSNGSNGIFINSMSNNFGESPLDIFNNTIVENNLNGIHAASYSISQSTNNIIAFNYANGIFIESESSHEINNDLIFGNNMESFAQEGGGAVMDNGSLSADPLLDQDFRPTSGSPCIDAGISVEGVPANDIDGDSRPLGISVDIGADEHVFE